MGKGDHMAGKGKEHLLRSLPGVDEVLQWEEIKGLLASYPRPLVVGAIRQAVGKLRAQILAETCAGDQELTRPALARRVEEVLVAETTPNLRPVINATGVVLHTNLGRAVLAEAAREHLSAIARGYCNLEVDLETGERGSRYSHVEELLTRLTGAEGALVVNNNAAAVLLALNTLAKGREVLVSRGQLVEIGGAFRIPEVMEWSGCRLVEVGATNKTRLEDYRQAAGPETALLLKVHTSNYRILGFTAEVGKTELVELGRELGLPVMEDLGSGVFMDLTPYGLYGEPTVQESVDAGVDVITFSGDKLLGGPQAGIIVGKNRYLEAMKKNPLTRALRIDKFTLGALEATLRLYLNPEDVLAKIPVLQMLSVSPDVLAERARSLAGQIEAAVGSFLQVDVAQDQSEVGGGALPLAQLPTWVVTLESPFISAAALAARLRQGEPSVFARIAAQRVLLDVRTLQEGEEKEICTALAKICKSASGS
ncbi:MAG: L-seryl-tRNA(Sec) selenium transferase [bacterium]